jgi:Domain of unknown function (DUF4412)
MKKIFLSLLSFGIISISSYSQSFEGQISYKIEVKGENAGMMAMMMPNSVDIFMLGKDALVRMNGGMAPTGDIITKGAEDMTYMVMHNKKTVYKMDPKKEDKSEAKPTVTVQGTETVNGYKCTKYLVKFAKTADKDFYQYMWCTTDLKIAKPQSSSKSSQFFLEEVEGFPVKMDQYITVTAQGMTMTINQEMVLDKISETKPDASLFQIPKKYKVEDFEASKLMPK